MNYSAAQMELRLNRIDDKLAPLLSGLQRREETGLLNVFSLF